MPRSLVQYTAFVTMAMGASNALGETSAEKNTRQVSPVPVSPSSGAILEGVSTSVLDESAGSSSDIEDSGLTSPLLPRKPSLLDRQRHFITDRYIELTYGLDRLLSRKTAAQTDKNHSYLVLDIETIVNQAADNEYNLQMRAKADLPNTKQRLKLIFESQPDEDLSLQDNERSGRKRNNSLTPDDAIAGIEYAQQADEYRWRSSLDIGTRLDFPLDLFSRIRLVKKTRVSQRTEVVARFEFPYFAREGAKPSFRFNLDHEINDRWSFGSVTRHKYSRREALHESFQSLQVNQWVSESLTIEYKIGAYGDSIPVSEIDAYFANVAFKKRAFRDWIYLSFIPEVSYAREDQWHPRYSFVFAIQAIYAQ